MIGFTASYASGEIRLQEDEIVEAGWFSRHGELPRLPGKLSIARRLIDAFLDQPRGR
jgi:NAD+ diphosphatase